MTPLQDWPGFLPYFRTTRSASGRRPECLAESAECNGEELDEEYGDNDDLMVTFVIQLRPVSTRAKECPLDGDGFLSTEIRIPTKCRPGITPVGIEQPEKTMKEEPEAFEAAEREAHQLRFSDDTDLAKHFEQVARAV